MCVCVCVCVCLYLCVSVHIRTLSAPLFRDIHLFALQCQYKPTVASLVAEVYKQVNTQEILAYCGTKLDLSTGASEKQRLV